MTRLDNVDSLLRALAPLLDPPDRDLLHALQCQLRERVLRIVVIGEAKRGKSTLVNALLHRDVAPTGAVPVTGISTTFIGGEREQVQVCFTSGKMADFPLAQLADFVTETRNAHNARRVDSVRVTVPSAFLACGVELVDTPGAGSVYAHNTAAAAAAANDADIAIFVLTADPPISASEREFLRAARASTVELFCVLNKADRLDREELEEVCIFTSGAIRAEVGQPMAIWALSARDTTSAGFTSFERALANYLRQHADADLPRSIATRGMRIAQRVRERVAVTSAALTVSADNRRHQLEDFRAETLAVDQERTDTAALLHEELRRLLAETNEQAQALFGRGRGALVRDLDAELRELTGPSRDIERAGMEILAERVRAVVDPWHAKQGHRIAELLGALERTLRDRLERHIMTVRAAAGDAFHVDLPDVPPAEPLLPPSRFSYAFGPEAGQFDLMTATVRRWLPPALARRAVLTYVTGRAPDLLDRQIGRARADLQQRLTALGRELEATLERRYVEEASHLAAAFDQASDVAGSHSAHTQQAIGENADRLQAIESVVSRLRRSANVPKEVTRGSARQ